MDCVKRHDPLHEQGEDSGSEETDEDIIVCDASTDSVALKDRDITLE